MISEHLNISEAERTLHKFWGYPAFRPGQKEIIEAVFQGSDVLALLPTGGGKSLCYQIPALMMDGLTVVISPLKALMSDQVSNLKQRGIAAELINSNLSEAEINTIIDRVAMNKIDLLYVAPERLLSEKFTALLEHIKIALIAVDEAHCISEWGHDFRPAYAKIADIRKLTSAPMLALTATATPKVQDQISSALKLYQPKRIIGSYVRPNLSYRKKCSNSKHKDLLELLSAKSQSAIVYVTTRRSCNELAKFLRDNGLPADAYHAGLTTLEREAVQEKWTQSATHIMVATNAFGMGVDKANVRLVVHWNTPMSPEALFQEAGRAGRDGEPAENILLWNEEDILSLKKHPQLLSPAEDLYQCYLKLCNYYSISKGELRSSSTPFRMAEFCTRYKLPQLLVFNTLESLQKNGVFSISNLEYLQSRAQLRISYKELREMEGSNDEMHSVLETLVRSYNALNEGLVIIDEPLIAMRSNLTVARCVELLKLADHNAWIKYLPAAKYQWLSQLMPRQDNFVRSLIIKNHKRQLLIRKEKSQAMINYLQQTERCNALWMLDFFGESGTQNCGKCEICERMQHDPERSPKSIKKDLLAHLKKEGPCSLDELERELGMDRLSLAGVVRKMISSGQVKINQQQKLEYTDEIQ